MTEVGVTQLLRAWNAGDPTAFPRLVPLVYEELRRVAAGQLREERSEHTLQPTALVHEAYLRLVDLHSPNWQTRVHFFGAAAELMRRVLVDYSRRRTAQKRGATLVRVDISEVNEPVAERDLDFEALDEALSRLQILDSRQARIVELRFFGGLSIEEAATLLQLSPATIKRELTLAKAWLFRELALK
jgi:RNA polymerase sigma factor (TIGR02999 family)